MKRHALDVLSLVSGAVFVVAAILYIASIDASLDLRWIVPAALVAVGAAGLYGALRGQAPDDGGPEG
jgi:hypothetical protein